MDTYEYVTYVTLLSHCFKCLLRFLDVTSARVGAIENHVFDGLHEMESLWLDENRIGLLPKSIFCGLEHLKELNLNANRFVLTQSLSPRHSDSFSRPFSFNALPVEWAKNDQVKINFSVRHIIPGTFQNLKNLEYLYMDSNRIQRIEPSTFYGLNKLKYLGLSKNYLKTLDKVSHFRKRPRNLPVDT